MFALALIVFLISIPAGIAGLVLVIKPIPPITKRRVGAAILAASFVMFWGGAITAGATMSPEMKAAGEAQQKKDQEDRARAAAAVAKVEQPVGVTQAEFDAVWGATKVVMDRCDAPLRRAGEIVGTGDMYAAYPAVQRAEDECNQAMLLMQDIDPPKSAKGDVKRAFLDAREACATTAFIKGDAMAKLAKVVNGDSRPSAFAEVKAELERGQLSNLHCLAKFAAAAEAAGLTLPEFKPDEAPAA
ncbi:hypothetical protein GCM10017620_26130 [Brevundimonas intermedia]|uniref:Uncharacterized protein n=1 Tax=Brevundimonas intermedia TaxID=74315 RepID=A0ABQ5TC88_9CAUL|nr:hypothetical protein [Brevundimonas intermedia]GLK49640.1 hypothetical protein GCM10017620_26130 [Brevundimonas intermedia]